jgi:hypothetical protein
MNKTITKMVSIPKMRVEPLNVTIKGLTPLIYHKWTEKMKKMIRDKQQKAPKQGREIRDTEQEYLDSFYYNSKGEIAFPAGSIKKSIVGAARSIDDVPMTKIRAGLFVRADEDNLIKVDYKEKVKREDMVRVGKGSADLRYRGQLNGWSMSLTIDFNTSVFSAEQVMNLLNIAGFSQGLGEWRPEKDGDFGRFTVV